MRGNCNRNVHGCEATATGVFHEKRFPLNLVLTSQKLQTELRKAVGWGGGEGRQQKNARSSKRALGVVSWKQLEPEDAGRHLYAVLVQLCAGQALDLVPHCHCFPLGDYIW